MPLVKHNRWVLRPIFYMMVRTHLKEGLETVFFADGAELRNVGWAVGSKFAAYGV